MNKIRRMAGGCWCFSDSMARDARVLRPHLTCQTEFHHWPVIGMLMLRRTNTQLKHMHDIINGTFPFSSFFNHVQVF